MAAKQSPQRRPPHAQRVSAPVGAPAPAAPRTPAAVSRRRHPRPLANPPSVAPCANLETLQRLSPEAAREHVVAYLREVMSPDEANAFEAGGYRWELHLVAIDEFRLLRGVELDTAKLRRYRRALARGTCVPAVVGLGGDGADVTRGVLLCDGYHRAVAMRDAGIHYVWAWLATGIWQPAPAGALALSR